MNDIDFTAAKFWFDVAQGFFTLAVAVYVWLANRRKANQAEIDNVNMRVRHAEDRVLKLEAIKAYLPSNEEIGQIHSRVDQVGQGLKGMEGELKQINNTMQLIQQHLLAEKGK